MSHTPVHSEPFDFTFGYASFDFAFGYASFDFAFGYASFDFAFGYAQDERGDRPFTLSVRRAAPEVEGSALTGRKANSIYAPTQTAPSPCPLRLLFAYQTHSFLVLEPAPAVFSGGPMFTSTGAFG